MLLIFTEFQTGNSIAINPKNVVCTFVGKDPKSQEDTTFINLTNGNIAVSEDYLTVVGRINGSLQ
jgi:hypothetical protein